MTDKQAVRMVPEKWFDDAPVWYHGVEASAWAAGWNACREASLLAAAPSVQPGAAGRLSALLSVSHLTGDQPIPGLGAVSWNDLRAILSALQPVAQKEEG